MVFKCLCVAGTESRRHRPAAQSGEGVCRRSPERCMQTAADTADLHGCSRDSIHAPFAAYDGDGLSECSMIVDGYYLCIFLFTFLFLLKMAFQCSGRLVIYVLHLVSSSVFDVMTVLNPQAGGCWEVHCPL